MRRLFFLFFLASMMFTIVGHATADLADDLVVYFTFDNVKDKRVLDESGNGLDAEVIENTKFVEGRYGNGIRITRETEDCVNVPTADELKISGEITMMAWVYHERWTTRTSQWFDKGCSSKILGSYGMAVFDKKEVPALNAFENGSGILVLLAGEGRLGSIVIQNEMKNKTWHHIVGSCSQRSLKIYLDGEMIVESNLGFDFVGTNDEDMRIGCAKNKPQYAFEDGIIDEVAIWSRALSEDEIRAAAQGPLFPVSPKDKIATTWGGIK